MPTIRLDPRVPDPGSIEDAAKTLLNGGLVAFPTETVYGLGANSLDRTAVRCIFAAKGRPAHNPLIVHVENSVAARDIAQSWPPVAEVLTAQFWPGPLTLIVRKRASIPDEVTAGLPGVAVRAPAHPVAQALLQACGVPIAAPSANRYMQLSPTTAEHVARAFGPELVVLDGGPCSVGIESTVLDLTREIPVLLRAGAASRAAIEAIIGGIELVEPGRDPGPQRSPGMAARHYAPRARLILAPTSALREALHDARTGPNQLGTPKIGLLQLSSSGCDADTTIAMPIDASGYSRALYAALHTLDDAGCDIIVAEAPPVCDEWVAVCDRLQRASHAPNSAVSGGDTQEL